MDVLANGEQLGAFDEPDCDDEGCELTWQWDTSTVAEGHHGLQLVAQDEHGNEADPIARTVLVDDVVTVKAMQVNNLTDESGALEMEVYLFDNAAGGVVGCAGGGQGLAAVDAASMRYDVNATLVDELRAPIGSFVLARSAVHFEVWEYDGSGTGCPTSSNGDLVGASSAMTTEQMRGAPLTMSFGNVGELVVALERPFTLQEAPKPRPTQPDNNDDPPPSGGFGGGGCSTGGSQGFGLALVLSAIARALRRSSGARRTCDRSRPSSRPS